MNRIFTNIIFTNIADLLFGLTYEDFLQMIVELRYSYHQCLQFLVLSVQGLSLTESVFLNRITVR